MHGRSPSLKRNQNPSPTPLLGKKNKADSWAYHLPLLFLEENRSFLIMEGYCTQAEDLSFVHTDEDIPPMHITMIGPEGMSRFSSSPSRGSKQFKFDHLEIQEQPASKTTARSHTEFVLDVHYMDGKKIL